MARPTLLLFGLLLSSSLAQVAMADGVIATAPILGADGSPHGTATLVARGESVTLDVRATGLPPGEHGIHLHTTGKCEPPAFASAGGHLNPAGKMHGAMNPQGSHLGDLSNLTIATDGSGTLSATLPGSAEALERDLFDADGTAIVIHAAADDYRTDPSGNSGGRIACGVFKQSS